MPTISKQSTIMVCITARSGPGLSLQESPYHGSPLAFRSLEEARLYIEDSQNYILECQPPENQQAILFDLQITFANGNEWKGVFKADMMNPEEGISYDKASRKSFRPPVRPQYLAEAVQRSLENDAEYSKDPEAKSNALQILDECSLEPDFAGADLVDDWTHLDLGKAMGISAPTSDQLMAQITHRIGGHSIRF